MNLFNRGALSVALLSTVLAMGGCSGSGDDSPGLGSLKVETVAGSSTFGKTDGPAAGATFHNPVNVALDSTGNIYVADFDNNAIRKITTGGVVSTLTSQTGFSNPFGITFAQDGSLYVQTDANDTGARDSTTGTIWRINLATGAATVVARNLGRPRGLTALADGRLVLSDLATNTIRVLNPTTAAITTLAGTAGVTGFADGTGAAAKFDRPYGAAVLPNGDILVADQNNNRLREISLTGVVTTYAGTGVVGSADGARLSATLNHPEDVDVDLNGNVYIDDHDNQTIRLINTSGGLSTIAGGLPAGFVDATGLGARFFGQEGIAITPDGKTLYIADGTNGEDTNAFSRVRKLSL
ncbi:MAG: repeat-containing protein [Capsulimonas sp.]|nr:repeat-containing protein [Capsulimonas sp.]